MAAPTYLLEKIARHGSAVQRLQEELSFQKGEFVGHKTTSAIAFDAADFVWAYFAMAGYSEVQETRELRNCVAQEINKVLRQFEWLNDEMSE